MPRLHLITFEGLLCGPFKWYHHISGVLENRINQTSVMNKVYGDTALYSLSIGWPLLVIEALTLANDIRYILEHSFLNGAA